MEMKWLFVGCIPLLVLFLMLFVWFLHTRFNGPTWEGVRVEQKEEERGFMELVFSPAAGAVIGFLFMGLDYLGLADHHQPLPLLVRRMLMTTTFCCIFIACAGSAWCKQRQERLQKAQQSSPSSC